MTIDCTLPVARDFWRVITMGEKTHPGSRDNLLSKTPDAAMLDLTSVEKKVTPTYPSTFVWCGDADRTVDPEDSRMLAGELKKTAFPTDLWNITVSGLGKGWPVKADLEKL